jgi:hypothetical protein
MMELIARVVLTTELFYLLLTCGYVRVPTEGMTLDAAHECASGPAVVASARTGFN